MILLILTIFYIFILNIKNKKIKKIFFIFFYLNILVNICILYFLITIFFSNIDIFLNNTKDIILKYDNPSPRLLIGNSSYNPSLEEIPLELQFDIIQEGVYRANRFNNLASNSYESIVISFLELNHPNVPLMSTQIIKNYFFYNEGNIDFSTINDLVLKINQSLNIHSNTNFIGSEACHVLVNDIVNYFYTHRVRLEPDSSLYETYAYMHLNYQDEDLEIRVYILRRVEYLLNIEEEAHLIPNSPPESP